MSPKGCWLCSPSWPAVGPRQTFSPCRCLSCVCLWRISAAFETAAPSWHDRCMPLRAVTMLMLRYAPSYDCPCVYLHTPDIKSKFADTLTPICICGLFVFCYWCPNTKETQKRLHAMLSPCFWQRKRFLDSLCTAGHTYGHHIWFCQQFVKAQ